jgi:catechol 2,3-dioxygenase-like lactoylglutathione lyase family enzyme
MPLGRQRIMAFVATAEPERAQRFYCDVLGLELVEDTPFALVFATGGAVLRMQKVATVSLAPYTALGWQVADVAGMVETLTAKGVEFARFPGLAQDSLGTWTAPDGQKIAWFKDPDGNILSLSPIES